MSLTMPTRCYQSHTGAREWLWTPLIRGYGELASCAVVDGEFLWSVASCAEIKRCFEAFLSFLGVYRTLHRIPCASGCHSGVEEASGARGIPLGGSSSPVWCILSCIASPRLVFSRFLRQASRGKGSKVHP